MTNAYMQEGLDAFKSGQVAMQMNWFAFFPGLYKDPNVGGDKIGFFVNPAGPKGTVHAARRPGHLGRLLFRPARTTRSSTSSGSRQPTCRRSGGSSAATPAHKSVVQDPSFPKSAPFAAGVPEVDGDRQGLLGRARSTPSCCSTCRSACMTTSSPTRERRRRRSICWSRTGTRSSRRKARSRRKLLEFALVPRLRCGGRAGTPIRGRQACWTGASLSFRSELSRRGRAAVARQLARPVGPEPSPGSSSRPTIVLLLAINIFPADLDDPAVVHELTSRTWPSVPIKVRRHRNYVDILTDDDIWHAMQVTARFVVLIDRASRSLLGFGLALLIDREFRGHGFWTTVILVPMMLSPAVVGNFWTLLASAADRPVQLRRRLSRPAFAAPRSR